MLQDNMESWYKWEYLLDYTYNLYYVSHSEKKFIIFYYTDEHKCNIFPLKAPQLSVHL